MKKSLLISICLITCLLIHAGPVSNHGQLKVDGKNMVDKNNQQVILRGVSFGWSNWWGEFYNEKCVDWLASDWNISVIRAAMGVEPEEAYISNSKKQTELVTTVVDAAIKNDIYIIIDWHSHGIQTEEAVKFFKLMASKYKDYPNIIYEIFNEPVNQSWKEVKEYSEAVIKAIREIDKDNIILVGTPHWDQDVHIAADDPITGYNNIMYTLHFYAATHKQGLIDRGNYALSKGLPLFVSECAAMEASGDGPIDRESWNTWLTWMETNKISWVCWSVSPKNETCSMIKDKKVSPLGKWKDADLKEWGRIVRKEITQEQ